MSDPFDLQRFVTAQEHVIERAFEELRRGAKRTHWMWFVFSQISGLSCSPMGQRFAIASLDEAAAYLAHTVLGPRLVDCVELVLRVERKSLYEIFGSPDDAKFLSCVTLFAAVPDADPVFERALRQLFAGQRDQATLDRL